MAEEKDDPSKAFDGLARRYLDLWQSQLSGLAADPALTEQVARLFAATNAQVASFMEAAQGTVHAATTVSGVPPSGTASAAAASRHGADDLGELRKRVAALEERIAELEARLSRA